MGFPSFESLVDVAPQGGALPSFESLVDVPEKDGRKFIPDAVTDNPISGQIGAVVQAIGDQGLFKIGKPIEARLVATGQEIKEALGLIAPKPYAERVKERTKQLAEHSSMLREEFPIGSTIGDMIGMTIDPINKVTGAWKAATMTKKLLKSSLQFAAVTGEGNVIDAVDQAVQGQKPISEGLTDAAIGTLGAAGVGAFATVVPGAFKSVLAPVRAWGKIAAIGLNGNAKIVVEEALNIARMGLKKANAEEVMKSLGQKAVGIIKSARDSLNQGVTAAAEGLNPELQKLVSNLNKNINLEAISLAGALKGKAPQEVAASLTRLAETFQGAWSGLHTAFGQQLDDIGAMTGGKKITGTDAFNLIKQFVNVFVDEGSAAVGRGKITVDPRKTKFSANAINYLNGMLGKEELTFNEVHQMMRHLGEAFKMSASNAESQAAIDSAKNVWGVFKETISNPAIWGEKAAGAAKLLSTEYRQAIDVMSSLTKTAEDTGLKARGIIETGGEDSLFSRLNEFHKSVIKVADISNRLKSGGSLTGILTEEQLQAANEAVKQVQRGININKLGTLSNVRKNLENFVTGKHELVEAELKGLLEKWNFTDEFKAQVDQLPMAKALRDAIKKPFDTTTRTSAISWVNTYGHNNPELRAGVESLINKSARAQRLGELHSMVDPKEMLDSLVKAYGPEQKIITEEAAQQLGFAINLTKELRQLLMDERMVNAYIKDNPSIVKELFASSGYAAVGGLTSAATRNITGIAIAGVLALLRIAKNPQALLIAAENANVKLSQKTAFAIKNEAMRVDQLMSVYKAGLATSGIGKAQPEEPTTQE